MLWSHLPVYDLTFSKVKVFLNLNLHKLGLFQFFLNIIFIYLFFVVPILLIFIFISPLHIGMSLQCICICLQNKEKFYNDNFIRFLINLVRSYQRFLNFCDKEIRSLVIFLLINIHVDYNFYTNDLLDNLRNFLHIYCGASFIHQFQIIFYINFVYDFC